MTDHSPAAADKRLQQMAHAQTDLTPAQQSAFRAYFPGALAANVADDDWDRAVTTARDLALFEAARTAVGGR